ncbi:MAG: hypothetical protein DRJ52_05775 [Thermoprotei archaeon]|nr:MAG: hypothetical protein DRJ52_05775 [Thermoprotei archaeon]
MKSCINGATTMPYSLEEDIRAASEAGFKAVEIWVGKLKKFLARSSKSDLKRLLEDFNVSAPCLCAFGGYVFCSETKYEERVNKLKPFLEVGNYIGSEYIIVCAEGLGGKSFEEALKQYVFRLRKLGSLTGEYGIKVALEWFEKLPPAIEIVRAVNHENIGFLIDTFHWYRGDGSLDHLREVPEDKLFFVHINDCEDLPQDRLADKHRLFCGEGVIPLIDVLKIFCEKEYEGYLSVEIFREEYWKMNAVDIAKKAYDSLIRVASAAGVSLD